ncbi:MAG: UPF0182 family protein [Deltaproteobacteria bacterium]|nr:UPF0182 family protein [Deltaproteobacteria bacterium]
MSKRMIWWLVLLALLMLAAILATTLYLDWLWFEELQQTVVFATAIGAKIATGVVCLILVFGFALLNLSLANRGRGAIEIRLATTDAGVSTIRLAQRPVQRALIAISITLAALTALWAAGRWEIIWRWWHRVPFGQADPIFARDISFYVFTLPLLQLAVKLGLTLCVLCLAGVGAIYYFKGSLALRGLTLELFSPRAKKHLSLLAALFMLFLGASAWLERYLLLYSRHELLAGANYADLHGRLPLLSVLAVCAVAGGVLFAVNAWSSRNRTALVGVALYLIALLVVKAYPPALQKLVVDPNELARESPQILHNIDATLQAYNLSRVEDRNLVGDEALTAQEIQANAATIGSIRLWDHEPLLDTFSQIQEIRTYYDFISVDNDRYLLDKVPRQTMLSARELDSASLPERNWINEHLSYTHGYGITLGPVNRVTPEGLPQLLIQDIPPHWQDPVFKIDRPEIYYGELTRGYVAVRTGAREFDYPSGEENVYATYEGTGGVRVNSFLRKLLFALHFRDINILLSPLLKPDSRFLFNREIRVRLGRLAPFLILDRDPYLVVSGGKLLWIQDGYTTSDRYPYALPTQGVGNYLRNSVKMVVDAYHGSADLYVVDETDPIVQVYRKIYPGLLKPGSEMPADIRAHMRYPEDLFRLQTYVYAVYHMTNPQVFYNKEDQWEIPIIASGSEKKAMAPYYTIMRLPQEQREEFILMLPFTPRGKDNLSAWMVARSDGEHYGKLAVYRFPKQKLVYGPKQIVARINQDAEISRQISLWDQRGSQVIQGTLLVIPIEEGLIYVRPLYLRSDQGKIPELKRVIVAYENRIAMEETLDASLARLFPAATTPPAAATLPASPAATQPEVGVAALPGTAPAAAGHGDLLRAAREAYDNAVQAQRQGDWARYGDELKRLGEILNTLQQTSP